jgi:DNA-binding NarL/FixJ family response regulator
VLGCHHGAVRQRVLIIDDHLEFRAQAGALLAAAGYVVIGEAGDGESGVQAARDVSPDVVLLDVQLPDISGFEAAERIRGVPDPPVVILISSRDVGDYGRRIRQSGARAFITKSDLSASRLSAALETGDR